MTALDREALAAALQGLPSWSLADGQLHRKLRFADFAEAFAWMSRVALLAERLQHHPDWRNSYATVEVWLTTHDAGGITEKDVELARLIGA